MSESQRLGLSEEEVEAAEVLGVLKQSCRQKSQRSENVSQGDRRLAGESSTTPLNILDRVSNKIISNVVTFYDEINTNKRPLKSIGRLLDDDDDEHDDYDYYDEEFFTNKRQKLSQVIAKGKDNLKEYKLNMSIESKKRLITCLHLLKLANKQLSDKISCLQDLVEKEQVQPVPKQDCSVATTAGAGEEETSSDDDDDEEFFDASEQVNANEQSIVVKMEVVGTVKKVYSLISKFTANSLPEPARSQVRESLLNLPTNWFDSVQSTSLPQHTSFHHAHHQEQEVEQQQQQRQQQQQQEQQQQEQQQEWEGNRNGDDKESSSSSSVTPNGKVLILAKESLEMVRNVMGVVDSTLGKAEEWVKQKQEVKEMIKKRFLQQQQRDGHRIKSFQDTPKSSE